MLDSSFCSSPKSLQAFLPSDTAAWEVYVAEAAFSCIFFPYRLSTCYQNLLSILLKRYFCFMWFPSGWGDSFSEKLLCWTFMRFSSAYDHSCIAWFIQVQQDLDLVNTVPHFTSQFQSQLPRFLLSLFLLEVRVVICCCFSLNLL